MENLNLKSCHEECRDKIVHWLRTESFRYSGMARIAKKKNTMREITAKSMVLQDTANFLAKVALERKS